MAWRDNLRPASFRGIAFKVDGAQLVAGRRLARHEYPQRDIPYLEDMGRKAREYRVEAFVVGADYMAARDALLQAIEAAGPGQLVHPWHGTLSVTVSECNLSESTQHGGLAKFHLTFVEAGQPLDPTAAVDTAGRLAAAGAAGRDAFAADFARRFTVAGQPDFVVEDALRIINTANPLGAPLLPGNLLARLAAPLALGRALFDLVQTLSPADVPRILVGPAAAGQGFPGATPSRRAQEANSAALNDLLLQAATARTVSDLAQAGAETLDEARASRREIVSRVDLPLASTGAGTDATDALLAVRTAAIQHLAALTPTLPRLVTVLSGSVRPALVWAHDWYGDAWFEAGREDEIVTRNRIRHPGFTPAGKALLLEA